MSWASRPIKGVLLDITGVLYDGTASGGEAIRGSVQAVDRLISAGLPVRFCSNETSCTRKSLVEKLNGFGFKIKAENLFSPAPAVCRILSERGLRPYLVIHPSAASDYDGVDQTSPNAVVLGDAQESFNYDNLNKAFQVLLQSEKPCLFSLGKGKYYLDKGELALDVGAYMKALEYATGVEAEVVGKPAAAFFNSALADMGVAAEDAVMIGDDLENDVGGAQACGIRGVQVRTGKFRPSDETSTGTVASGRVANLAEAVDIILASRS